MPRKWWRTSSRPSSNEGGDRDQLIDGIGDPVLVLDRSRAVIDLNAAALRLAGAPPAWRGTSADALFPFLHGTPVSGPGAVSATVIRTPGACYDVRVWRVRAAGAAWLVLLRDVTEDQRAADERERFVKRSADLVSSVAHELRTPIATVQGALQLLAGSRRSTVAADDLRLVDNALRACERAAQIVHDILDITTLDTGPPPTARQPVSVERLVIDALFDAGRPAHDRGVRLQTAIEPDVPMIDGEHDRLVQVFVDLTTRAIARSAPGATVRVGARRDGATVLMQVAYEGPPLAPHEDEQTALGLAAALVARQGGRLSIDARRGTTTFLVRLRVSDDPRALRPRVTTTRVFARAVPAADDGPLAGSPVPAAAPAAGTPGPAAPDAGHEPAGAFGALPQPAARPLPPPPRPSTVLVADDDPDLRDVVGEALQAYGFRVLTAEDGDQTLAVIGSTPVDLLVLDLNMPRRNGLEVIAALRGEGGRAPLPILVLTGSVEERLTPDALGADVLLTKPTDLRRLVEEARRLTAG